jgi:hypothetical protein
VRNDSDECPKRRVYTVGVWNEIQKCRKEVG